MAFPSWNEFKEKAKKFEEFLDEKRNNVRQTVQSFKDKHETIDDIITTGVKFLPSPFDKIAEAIYQGTGGSDQQKLDNTIEYFHKIQKKGEEHYNDLIDNIKRNHEILKNNLYQSYGLNCLPNNYFEINKSNEEQDLELRRDRILESIKNKLETRNKLLIVGESGTSKTTILEILCDYFDKMSPFDSSITTFTLLFLIVYESEIQLILTIITTWI